MKGQDWKKDPRTRLGLIISQIAYFDTYFAGGGVPGHAGEQRTRGLRAGGAERDGSVLFRADRKTAARQVERGDTGSSVY